MDKRRFHVDIEGTRVLNNYDITADVGHSTAVIKTFTATVTDGTLNVAFSRGTKDNPTLAAIEVWTVGGSSATATPTLTPTPTPSPTLTRTNTPTPTLAPPTPLHRIDAGGSGRDNAEDDALDQTGGILVFGLRDA